MNNLDTFEDDKIIQFLSNGNAFDGYLYSMGVLLDIFIENGMHNCMIEPYDLRKIDIFKLSSDELANILINCVISSSDETKKNYLTNNLQNIKTKYIT